MHPLKRSYKVSQLQRHPKSALVDRGANGGYAGNNARLIELEQGNTCNVSGFGDHVAKDVPIGNFGTVAESHKGPVIIIMNQYAQGRGDTDTTIHSSRQMEAWGCKVMDTSKQAGGRQALITPDRYGFPLAMRQGLPYLDMRPYTDKELDELPHVLLTRDSEWLPDEFDDEPDTGHFDDISKLISKTYQEDTLQLSRTIPTTYDSGTKRCMVPCLCMLRRRTMSIHRSTVSFPILSAILDLSYLLI